MSRRNNMLLLVGTAALVLASDGKGVVAFSPTLAQTQTRLPLATRLEEASSSNNNPNNDPVNWNELMDSKIEQNRLNSMYRRFDHNDWLLHRASDRFYRNLFEFNWNKSIIVASLLDEVALLVSLSLGIILYNELVFDGWTDFDGSHHDPLTNILPPGLKLTLPLEPFLLCSGPLGFLIVFRNDASFTRYNEALAHWERIVSNFQNMMLMASTAAPNNAKEVRAMGLASWALVRTLQHDVSGEFDPTEDYEADIRKRVPAEQAEQLLNSRHLMYRAQYDVHQAIEPLTDHITVLDKRTLINTVNDVALQCVECERLYTTPIPLLYTQHTLKFLTFWMSLLPFALYNVFEPSWNHSAMVPTMAVLTFLFFGIEEIAVSLEEPFSILPLSELVDDVWVSIDDVTEWMSPNDGTAEEQKNNNGESANAEEEATTKRSKPPL